MLHLHRRLALNCAATSEQIGKSCTHRHYRDAARWTAFAIGSVLLACGSPASAAPELFTVTNLVTNDQSVNTASITDPSLLNSWGIAASGGSPFWVGDNGAGVSTLYTVNPTTNAVSKNALTVTIPGDGTVTGVTFNSAAAAGAFGGDNFLFVSEDGTISGWRNALGTAAEILQTGSTANVYKGSALATISGNTYLYGANFRTGAIDVVKGNGGPNLTGNFTDPNLPSGYAPFDIKLLNGNLFVTYAMQDPTKHDDVPGAGHGFVSEFDLEGNFLGRIASMGDLNSPWGLAIAPNSFGNYSGDLLVGNFGSGSIDAFNLQTLAFDGELMTGAGDILIDGLWALTTGNGGSGGSQNALYFTAGPNGEQDGLMGVINAVPEPVTLSVFGIGLAGVALARRRRRKVAA